MKTFRALLLTLALALNLVASASAHAQVPGNVGNMDDGVPVDTTGVTGADADWLPSADVLLSLDCQVEADPPFVTTVRGVRVVRGVGHWSCNHPVPLNTLEVCLDLVFPSVSCNERTIVRPSSGMSVKVDFPCTPGVYLTMATGHNPFVPPETDHSDYALVVLPGDCITIS